MACWRGRKGWACKMLSDSINRDRLCSVSPRKELTSRILDRLDAYEAAGGDTSFDDEQVWTILFVYGFIASEPERLDLLASVLTQNFEREVPRQAWTEMLPMSARRGRAGENESNSEIDIILR